MIEGFVHLERIKDEEEFTKLVELSKADSHGVYAPSVTVKNGKGELVGYFSIGSPGVPIVFAWLSTKEVSARDSFTLINMVETHRALMGDKAIAFPVPKDSPFHPYMEKIGYKCAGSYDFFVKKLV